ncbi:MAG: hypothetical protein ACON4O_03700 [Lentimonas sp.]
MAELTNLTDRITHLRDRNSGSSILPKTPPPSSQPKAPRGKSGERKFATDSFMLFVYALLGFALITQMLLIVWLDIL